MQNKEVSVRMLRGGQGEKEEDDSRPSSRRVLARPDRDLLVVAVGKALSEDLGVGSKLTRGQEPELLSSLVGKDEIRRPGKRSKINIFSLWTGRRRLSRERG